MEKIIPGLYATVETLKEKGPGGEDHVYGFPFLAYSHDHAKAMVYNTLKADKEKFKEIELDRYALVRLGRFEPCKDRPIVLTKGAPIEVCKVGDIFAARGEIYVAEEPQEVPCE